MIDPVFDTAQCFIRAHGARVATFIQSVLLELQAPKSLAARNLAQLQLAERVSRQFDMDVVSAVEAVAPLYERRFPKPLPKRAVVRRVGLASIVLH